MINLIAAILMRSRCLNSCTEQNLTNFTIFYLFYYLILIKNISDETDVFLVQTCLSGCMYDMIFDVAGICVIMIYRNNSILDPRCKERKSENNPIKV